MDNTAPSAWVTRLRRHMLARILSGVLILVPFVVALLVLRFVFRAVSSLVSPLANLVGPSAVPPQLVTVLSVLVVLLVLYLIGTIITHSIGKKVLALSETVFMKIPLLRSIYSSTKTVVSTLSMSRGASFRSVVFLQFPRTGYWSLGFVTGTTFGADGTEYVKVLIPTTPNPTTGFFEIVRKTDVVETKLSIEEGIQAIVSGGILLPSQLTVSLNLFPNESQRTNPEQTTLL